MNQSVGILDHCDMALNQNSLPYLVFINSFTNQKSQMVFQVFWYQCLKKTLSTVFSLV